MTVETCSNCHYHRAAGDGALRCHRHAPAARNFFDYYLAELLRSLAWAQATIANTAPDEDDDPDDDLRQEATEAMILTTWPEVARDDWCGDWKAQSVTE